MLFQWMNSSIIKRVTVWYTLFFSIITIIIFTGIYTISNYYLTSQEESNLSFVVKDAVQDYENDEPFESFDDGIYLSLYSIDGTLMQGISPIDLSNTSFKTENIKEIDTDTGTYMYMELFSTQKKVWIRGVTSVTRSVKFIRSLLQYSLYVFPLLIVIIILGGYFIIKKSLKPLKDMTITTHSIQNSMDLSQRIEENEASDEVNELIKSFNPMMDKVEISYQREKEFTSNVSHELRTPLAVLLAQTQFALEETEEESTRETLQIIEKKTKQMSKLVHQLLELARLDSWDSIEKKDFNLSSLLQHAVSDATLLANERGIQLHSSIEKEIYYTGNQLLITRIFDNLISNALKFTTSVINITLAKKNSQIIFTIQNDGEMIEEEHITKIFNRLYQIDTSRTYSKNHGNGLGLSFVDKIVKLHDGTIEVESNSKYTTFKIIF